ncbi:hypothetical protein FOMPIDRAFT_1026461 [Fomitopsis schrenkii]|uniref:Ubiquitin 3 binding protein But2 C-terminal domain-containing protein n=1 Tax=Fomitopsis schrenkii TaxID=2126942 RepID=S8DQZ3_FOMSC|nr:hypothetical protein FOMPIDRAFT_1026461 [Fomitopsis schrenkii]
MAVRGEESIALLDEGEQTPSDVIRQVQRRLQPEPKSTLSQWTTVALLLFVVVDLLAYLYVFSSIFHNISAPSPELEFRTPYRGLDDLYGSGEANSSKHDPIENVPRVAAIVNSEHPDKVYPQDEHRRLTAYGTVTPLDRHLRVSSTYHTILQFRVMDYGMERCALALRLPSNEDGDPKSADIELSVLDVSPQLDPSTISWSSRPASRNVVGTLRASSGEEVRLPEFPCRWGSLYAFEVSCAPGSPTCDVDVWADRDGTWGVFMYQFQTI